MNGDLMSNKTCLLKRIILRPHNSFLPKVHYIYIYFILFSKAFQKNYFYCFLVNIARKKRNSKNSNRCESVPFVKVGYCS